MRKLMLLVCLLLMTYGTAQGQDDFRLSAGNVPSLTLMAELRSPRVMAFAWSPDSTHVAYNTEFIGDNGNDSARIEILDVASKEVTTLVETANAAERILGLDWGVDATAK